MSEAEAPIASSTEQLSDPRVEPKGLVRKWKRKKALRNHVSQKTLIETLI